MCMIKQNNKYFMALLFTIFSSLKATGGTSLAPPGSVGLTPDQETKIPNAMRHKQKKLLKILFQ